LWHLERNHLRRLGQRERKRRRQYRSCRDQRPQVLWSHEHQRVWLFADHQHCSARSEIRLLSPGCERSSAPLEAFLAASATTSAGSMLIVGDGNRPLGPLVCLFRCPLRALPNCNKAPQIFRLTSAFMPSMIALRQIARQLRSYMISSPKRLNLNINTNQATCDREAKFALGQHSPPVFVFAVGQC